MNKQNITRGCCKKCGEWKDRGESLSNYTCYDPNCPCHTERQKIRERIEELDYEHLGTNKLWLKREDVLSTLTTEE